MFLEMQSYLILAVVQGFCEIVIRYGGGSPAVQLGRKEASPAILLKRELPLDTVAPNT